MIELEIESGEAEQRADRYLRKEFDDVPMGQIAKLFRKKKIRVNGVRAKADMRVGEGDKIQIYESVESLAHERKEIASQDRLINPLDKVKTGWGGIQDLRKSPLVDLAYEDDEIVIVNKESGVPVHPGSGQSEGQSLIEKIWMIMQIHPDARFKPQLVHRLDKGTSGLIVIALSGRGLKAWNERFRDRRLTKKYLALVLGCIEQDRGTIELDLERHDTQRGGAKMKVASHSDLNESSDKNSQASLTHYKVLKRYDFSQELNCTLVEVSLGTGRMHQIRAHFEHIGHPLVGDDRYGVFDMNKRYRKEFGLKRLFLHAAKLSWPEGKTWSSGKVEAKLPLELQKVVDKLNSK